MQRAATGLAGSCLRRLARGVLRRAGRRARRRRRQRRRRAVRRRPARAPRSRRRRADRLAAAARGRCRGRCGAAGGRCIREAGDDRLTRPAGAGRLVLDGLVGIGGQRRAARGGGPAGRSWSAGAARTLAVDVPSGVDAATGAVEGAAVRAAAHGHLRHGQAGPAGAARRRVRGRRRAGRRSASTLPAGRPASSSARPTSAALLPDPGVEARSTPAASSASPPAATRTRAPRCCAPVGRAAAARATCASPAPAIRPSWCASASPRSSPPRSRPTGDGDAVLAAGRVQAWVVGPGLGTDDAAAAVVRGPARRRPAGAGRRRRADDRGAAPELLRDRAGAARPTLLTPHEGEFARLVGGDPDDVTAAARRRPARDGARRRRPTSASTVLLKGSTTLVVDPDGRARVNGTGTGWLATAGQRRRAVRASRGAARVRTVAASTPAASAPTCTASPAQLAVERHGPPLAALDLLDALPGAWAAGAHGDRSGGRDRGERRGGDRSRRGPHVDRGAGRAAPAGRRHGRREGRRLRARHAARARAPRCEAGASWLGRRDTGRGAGTARRRHRRPDPVAGSPGRATTSRRPSPPASTCRPAPPGWSSQSQAAARAAGRPARVHLNVDTGLHRAGATAADWPELVDAALRPQAEGTLETGRRLEPLRPRRRPGHPTVRAQLEAFREALEVAERARAAPAGAPPGQLGRDARQPRRALRPGTPRRRGLRPVARAAGRAGRRSSGWCRR